MDAGSLCFTFSQEQQRRSPRSGFGNRKRQPLEMPWNEQRLEGLIATVSCSTSESDGKADALGRAAALKGEALLSCLY